MEEKCEEVTLFKSFCLRKAERWKEYMDEFGEDYYEENKC